MHLRNAEKTGTELKRVSDPSKTRLKHLKGQGNATETPMERALSELSRHFTSKTFSLKKASAITLRYARELTGSEHGLVGVIRAEDGELRLHAMTQRLRNKDIASRFMSGADGLYESIWGHSLNTETPFFTNNPRRHKASGGMAGEDQDFRNFMGVPVFFCGQIVGLIALANSDRNYSRQDVAAVGRLAGMFSIAVNQVRVKQTVAEKTTELEKAIQSFRNVFELTQDMLCIASLNRLIKVNPAFTVSLGYSEKELLSRSLKDLVHPDDMSFTTSLIKRKLKKGNKVFRFVNRVITRSGECRHLEWVSTPLIDGNLLFASARDITERIEAEQALRESEERFRTLADLLPEIVFETDSEGLFTYVNRLALNKTGYDERDVAMGLNFTNLLVPEDRDRGDMSFRRLMRGEQMGGVEYTMLKKDGTTFPVVIRSKPLERYGSPAGIRGVVIDMTHMKKKENALLKSLKEKEVLLQEVHHRVKNNMSIISSLLSLQANASGDERVERALKESRDRIRSLALVHEMLYKSKDFSNISFGDYARSICEALASSYDTGVDMCINCGKITLPLEALIPIGLILNEAFTNSIKYAFDNGHAKKIDISLKRDGSGLVLVIKDNGKGMPAEVIKGDGRNLGLNLISQLSQQLMGDFDISNQSGTTLKITFPAPQAH